MGVVDTIQLAAAVALALPIALLGAQLALDGQSLGYVFLALAALLVVVQHFLTMPTPGDIGGKAAERAASAVVVDDDEE